MLIFMTTEIIAQNDTLTVMSYNIYHGENPYKSGEPNIEEISDLIKSINPDFLALQEVDSMTVRTAGFAGEKKDLTHVWADKTGMLGHFAKAIDFSEGGYGEAVLTKHPATFESFSLPVPAGGEGRSMAIAHVELGNGRKISFAGTHLCHESEVNRTAQVHAIVDFFKDYVHPVVIAGDFNLEEDEEGYTLMSEFYQDAAHEARNVKPTYSTEDPKIRIDYIWVSKKSEVMILEVDVLDIAFSDHMPLIAKVKFPK